MTPREAQHLAQNLAEKFKSRATWADQKGQLPAEDIQDLKNSGLLKLCIPKSYGGWEGSLKTITEVQLELSQGSGSTALVVAMTLHVMSHARETRLWPENIYKKIAQDVSQGALINAIASEPRLGSPSRGGLPDTTAIPKGKDLVIHGHKTWASGGKHLKHLLLRVRLEDTAISVWIPANTPGLHWKKTWGHGLSLRGSDSHDLILKKVQVPQTHILEQSPGPPNFWFAMLIAATYLGMAIAARDEAIRYALERVPTALGKPIATLSGIQRQIGDMDIQLQAAKSLLLQTASEWKATPKQYQRFQSKATTAKYVAVETALKVTDQALRIVGAAGLESGLAIERHFRDVRAGLMHPPSGDLALEAIGRQALENRELKKVP